MFSQDRPYPPPELLQLSIERLWLDVTEPLDQYVALKLVQLLHRTVDFVYAVGFQDGQHTCALVPPDEARAA